MNSMNVKEEEESDLEAEGWGGTQEVLGNPDEQRVLFAALDSF